LDKAATFYPFDWDRPIQATDAAACHGQRQAKGEAKSSNSFTELRGTASEFQLKSADRRSSAEEREVARRVRTHHCRCRQELAVSLDRNDGRPVHDVFDRRDQMWRDKDSGPDALIAARTRLDAKDAGPDPRNHTRQRVGRALSR
jgi:hypothetical protein